MLKYKREWQRKKREDGRKENSHTNWKVRYLFFNWSYYAYFLQAWYLANKEYCFYIA